MKPTMLLGALALVAALSIQSATLPYQGLATDAKGIPKADASYPVGFALYSVSTGGAALWSESQSVSTKKGLFSTTLGSVTTIPDSLFKGTALFLGVSFDSSSEGGRVQLGTTPLALHALKADSASSVLGLQDSLSAIRNQMVSLISKLERLSIVTQQLAGLIDDRDGSVYKIVEIGKQTWMAQNLNFRNVAGHTDSVGVCYSNKADLCTKYGRYYTWASALSLDDSCNTKICMNQVAAIHKGVCPSGWRIPQAKDWDTLVTYLENAQSTDSMNNAVLALKSTSGWSDNLGGGNGTNSSGMNILPAAWTGPYGVTGGCGAIGQCADFWTTSETFDTEARFVEFSSEYRRKNNYEYGEWRIKSTQMPVRCLKD